MPDMLKDPVIIATLLLLAYGWSLAIWLTARPKTRKRWTR